MRRKHLRDTWVDAVSGVTGVDVAICPPFTALERVSNVVCCTGVGLGAQNMYWEAEGAFTGEVSAPMLLTAVVNTLY